MYTEIAKNIDLKKSELKVCFSIVNARELLEDTIIYISKCLGFLSESLLSSSINGT